MDFVIKNHIEISQEHECIVCLEETSKIEYFFECKHFTCHDCFFKLKKAICPYCRRKSIDVSIKLIEKHGVYLAMSKFIDKMNVSKNALLLAVSRYGTTLQFALAQDEDIALTAVLNSGFSIFYVFPYLQTEKVCLAAIDQNPESFSLINKRKQTKSICLYALRINGLLLEHVVKKLRTIDLCLVAVKQNGLALRYVKRQTKEICKYALFQNKDAFRYVKRSIGSENYYQICILAVNIDGLLLRYVKRSFRTEFLSDIATNQNMDATVYKNMDFYNNNFY